MLDFISVFPLLKKIQHVRLYFCFPSNFLYSQEKVAFTRFFTNYFEKLGPWSKKKFYKVNFSRQYKHQLLTIDENLNCLGDEDMIEEHANMRVQYATVSQDDIQLVVY